MKKQWNPKVGILRLGLRDKKKAGSPGFRVGLCNVTISVVFVILPIEKSGSGSIACDADPGADVDDVEQGAVGQRTDRNALSLGVKPSCAADKKRLHVPGLQIDRIHRFVAQAGIGHDIKRIVIKLSALHLEERRVELYSAEIGVVPKVQHADLVHVV